MAIATAMQRGYTVYVYDERGNTICVLSGGSSPRDGLRGFTSGTVSIQIGYSIYVYDERGNVVSVVPAG